MKALIDFDAAPIFGIPLTDGLGVREGMLLEGPQGWGEFGPPPDCDDRAAARWLTAAMEGGTVGWPDPRRGRIPIAVAVPSVAPAVAHGTVVASGCRTADVAVDAYPDSRLEEIARVEAVRDALGDDGRIRLRINALGGFDAVVGAIAALADAAGRLEFVELICRTVDEFMAVRSKVDGIRIAADATWAAAADVVILRSAPLGGVRRALRLAELSDRPCVVASTGETSIGTASGLALAGALPELPFACTLGTTALTGDLVSSRRALVPVNGYLPVAPMPAAPDLELVARYALTDRNRVAWWRNRLRSAAAAV